MLLAAKAAAGASGIGVVGIIAYIAFFGGLLYFMTIRPQKNQEKRQKDILANIEIGDTVLTTSGFIGMIIDIQDDTVIVEFGNNKNCRIPMQKNAIVDVEKVEE
ncbi:MAG: preprotein translocase subunit YajC [Eubacterium sp.]|nr:preprotein translocase subunit YajC [Eubacterium sp.]